MNKNALWVKLTAYIVLFLIFLIAAVGIIMRANGKFDFNIISFNKGSETMETKSFENIKDVKINVISEKIDVIEHSGTNYIVEYYTNNDSNKVEISEEGGTLSIVKTRKTITLFNFSWNDYIVVKVPTGTSLNYDVKNVSGSIDVNVKSDDLKIDSTSGSIEVTKGGTKLIANSTSGSIKVYEPFEEQRCNSVSGSVKLSANESTKNIYAETVSGSVKISKPKDLGYEISYKTVSGSVKDEYNGSGYEKSGNSSYGDKAVKINAKTTSGSIKLTDW